MMTSILFFCVYGYHLLVPGYLITRLLGLRRGRFLLAFALSYALLLLNLMPMVWLRAPLWVFYLAFNLQVVILLLANVTANSNWRKTATPSLCRITFARWWPALAIVAGVVSYLAWAGPYTELPADAWNHIVRSLYAQHRVASSHFASLWMWDNISFLEYVSHQGWHWNMAHALLCKMSGITTTDSWLLLSMANTIVFCLAIYWFAMFLWSRRRLRRIQKIQASLWTTGFTALWMGVSVFAYIRYYTFAPGMLNYIIYLAVVVLVLDYLRSCAWWSHALWLVPILLAIMNVIHTQEAMFACFMGFGMLIVMEGQWVWTKIGSAALRRLPAQHRENITNTAGVNFLFQPRAFFSGLARVSRAIMVPADSTRAPVGNMPKVHVLFVGGLIILGLLLYNSIPKPMAIYSDTVLKPVFHSAFLHQAWFIQPPAGQFFQVVTWWGLFTYALFLVYFKNFIRQPFILAGMLMPFFTVFNPLTLAIIARWIPDTNAIYRFNYMIPLPFVAGFLAMRFWNKRWKLYLPAQHINEREKLIGAQEIQSINFPGIWAAVALLGLVVLLMPFEPLFGMKSNSRFYTLRPVPEGNDQHRWGDLIALVKTHPRAVILSDSYTTTILHWHGLATSADNAWLRASLSSADRLDLLRKLDRRHDFWLVVNRRNGDYSMNGFRSGHWPADVLMHFPALYSEDLILFIKQHPELFKEIWSKDQIQVYDIIESRLQDSQPVD